MKKYFSLVIVMIILITSVAGFTAEKVSDTVKPILINKEINNLTVETQIVNGKMMVPVAKPLESLGYEVIWHPEERSVEIHKGAQWTKVFIDENSYFKNKMAPQTLSNTPVIRNDRTLVPVEFFNIILDLGIQFEEGMLRINEKSMAYHEGFIQKVSITDGSTIQLFISGDESTDAIEQMTVITVSSATTIFNKPIKKGEFIHVIAKPMMTMSIPGQTPGVVIY